MGTLRGDDVPDGFGRVSGFGVLGTGTPSTVHPDPSGQNDFPANSVGIWGVVGSQDDIATEIDNVTNNFSQSVTAAVLGVSPKFTPGNPGTLEHIALGFLAGNDPRFNQPTGVYGESSQLGVFGVGNQSGSNFDPGTGGSGVVGSGYIGVRGETQTGVAVLGRIFGGPNALAGLFQGNVKIEGRILVPGGDLEQRVTQLEQLQQRVVQLEQQVNDLLERLNAQQPAVSVNPLGTPRLGLPSNIGNQFVLAGDGFTPHQAVTLRVADSGAFHIDSFTSATADANGHVEFRFSLPQGFSIAQLFFAASDGRSNRHDLTGKLWANSHVG